MNQNTNSENCFNSAVQQISMIRDRDISCKELLDLHIDNLKKYNPKVNAIVTQTLPLDTLCAPVPPPASIIEAIYPPCVIPALLR